MEDEKTRGLCPACGKLLEIPGSLTEFSCLYCGKRLERGALLPEKRLVEAAPAGDGETCLKVGTAALLEGITRYPKSMQNLTRSGFVPFFDKYEKEFAPGVEQLDLAARELGIENVAKRAAEGFFLALDEFFTKNRKPFSSRDGGAEDAKFTLCIFLLPMIRRQNLEISEPLATEIYARWKKTYPKHEFSLTTYEVILDGFKNKRLCFITTAVCQSLGKPDDCRELTAFRAFRDGYPTACPDGDALIREYYDIAPGIVTAIRCGGGKQEFSRIWEEYLSPCYDRLLRGDNRACKKTYTEMVEALKRKYLQM